MNVLLIFLAAITATYSLLHNELVERPLGSNISLDEPLHYQKNESTNPEKNSVATEDHLIFRMYPQHHYLSTWNRTSQKAGILDYKNNLSIFYDGYTGDAFGILYEEQRGVYIPGNVTSKSWNVHQQSYYDYFKSPISPTELIHIGKKSGFQFDSLSLTSGFAERMTEIITPLSPDYNDQCEAFATVLRICKITSDKMKTSLWGFEQNMKSGFTNYREDLEWLVGLFQGLSYFFEPFGSVNVLQDVGIKLDLKRLFNEANAFKALSYCLTELAPKFDLGKILGKRFNSPLEFFTLLSKISGEISYGFDGFIFVTSEILKVEYDENSRGNLINTLKDYFFNPRAKKVDLKQTFLTEIKEFIETLRELELDNDFQELVEILKKILDGKWEHQNVNISKILNAIIDVEFPATPTDFTRLVRVIMEEFNFEKKNPPVKI